MCPSDHQSSREEKEQLSELVRCHGCYHVERREPCPPGIRFLLFHPDPQDVGDVPSDGIPQDSEEGSVFIHNSKLKNSNFFRTPDPLVIIYSLSNLVVMFTC